MQNNKVGTLYVVATPIGNLQDITLRAIEVLKKVNRIIAEDTRHSAPLLKHFSIDKPTLSLHDFNERKRIKLILDYLEAGESLALISDAGTPLISDPGFNLVREAKACDIEIVPIPGACALITALCVSGLPTDKFIFQGFLPAKREANHHVLAGLLHETRTMIFYEAKHRLLKTLEIMADVFGNEHEVVIAKELTKLHESVFRSDLASHLKRLHANPELMRGEVVILVAGFNPKARKSYEISGDELLDHLLSELPVKLAVTLTSKITGDRKNIFYKMALEKKEKSEGF